jgi:hypothetical protein
VQVDFTARTLYTENRRLGIGTLVQYKMSLKVGIDSNTR